MLITSINKFQFLLSYSLASLFDCYDVCISGIELCIVGALPLFEEGWVHG